MKGDFSRFSNNNKKHYTGVLKQQGRVDLDADWNEQVQIHDYLSTTKAKDVIGPCGVPKYGGGFEIKEAHNIKEHLGGVHFVNENKGWVVGINGSIFTTEDGGKSWEKRESGVGKNLNRVLFVSESKGWIVGDSGTILNTTDGGKTWNEQAHGVTENNLYGVSFVDERIGWVVGTNGTILSTTDGGKTWNEQAPGVTENHLYGVSFVDERVGWVIGESGTILATTDGGTEWKSQKYEASLEMKLINVCFVDNLKGWAVGYGVILATSDGGINWKQQEYEATNEIALYNVCFVDELRGWAVGYDYIIGSRESHGVILGTEDGGEKWKIEKTCSGVRSGLIDICFFNESMGWAVGYNGTILSTEDGGENWTLWEYQNNLKISPGRIYVDGILCELDNYSSYLYQPDYPNPPGLKPPDEEESRTDLVYLDVWQRHITAIEDPEIREVALGGPDTTTRIKTLWQVKIKKEVGDENIQCTDDIDKWPPAESTGRLTTMAFQPDIEEKPCLVPPSGGYTGLENRLYRVEIHEGGELGEATFKWSRDNGSIVYSIENFIPEDENSPNCFKVQLVQTGRDKVLKIKKGDWLEIAGEETHLEEGKTGIIAKVIEPVDEANRIVTLNKDAAAYTDETNPKVRRWDTGEDTMTPPTLISGETIELEEGVHIRFSGGNFKKSDYWVFAARTSIGKVDELKEAPPQGIEHHYCKLAIVKWHQDRTVDVEDCRPQFPPLTEIPKGEGEGCCTVTVGDDGDYDNIQAAVDALLVQLAKGLEVKRGTVCILPGIYVINEPISIMDGWDITILGCSGKSLIINNTGPSEHGAVFKIENSWHINIRNLWSVTIKGHRVIHSINSRFLQVNDCVMIAAGYFEIPGVITFQGKSLGCILEKNLLVGIVGIRFGVSTTEQEQYIGICMEKNAVFALESAVSQESAALLSAFNVVDNLLLGFGANSLLYRYFPTDYIIYAKINSMYDPETIEKAEKIHEENPGFESITASNITPLLGFVNHLRTEEGSKKSKSKFEFSEASTAAPVIDLRRGCLDSNFYNNILMGRSGIHAELVLESSLGKNMIYTFSIGINLGTFEGLTIDDNLVVCGSTCIRCSGKFSNNLTVSNNRLSASYQNIAFWITPGNTSNLVMNAQISRNCMTNSKEGIYISDPAVCVYDFSAVDNSILCSDCGISLYGFDAAPIAGRDVTSFQRVIQRNSIQTGGIGIISMLANVKIIDNDIYVISQKQFPSYGIHITGENYTIANNTISAFVNIEKGYKSQGGIATRTPYSEQRSQTKKFKIESNRISGGLGNGINILTYVDNGVIANNFICDMSLNGIAAQYRAVSDNLTVSNNTISNCCNFNGVQQGWWKYAGIVLYRGKNIQIMGNKILENGKQSSAGPQFQAGGFYADKLETAVIADNLFIDNGAPQSSANIPQAVIHIVGGIDPEFNTDVKIVSNIVKDSHPGALLIGTNVSCNYISDGAFVCVARDRHMVITNNHFESLSHTPAVKLQTSYCTFSNNFVKCPDVSEEPGGPLKSAVDLGVGWYVIAVGNVLSAPIRGAGSSLILQPNMEF